MQILVCQKCGKSFEKEVKEINRKIREKGSEAKFFCTLSCGAAFAAEFSRRPTVVKTCPCGNTFETNEITSHCSRRCASLYSFNEHRRHVLLNASSGRRFNSENALELNSDGLRVREWSKYTLINEFLNRNGIQHAFEYPIPQIGRIFDLALFEASVFVEFDERHHNGHEASEDDNIKDEAAAIFGWQVYRINVIGFQAPYPIELILPLLRNYEWWYQNLQ